MLADPSRKKTDPIFHPLPALKGRFSENFLHYWGEIFYVSFLFFTPMLRRASPRVQTLTGAIRCGSTAMTAIALHIEHDSSSDGRRASLHQPRRVHRSMLNRNLGPGWSSVSVRDEKVARRTAERSSAGTAHDAGC